MTSSPTQAAALLPIRFVRYPDDPRYIVFLGDDRIGFVVKGGARWSATDTYMVPARSHATRAKAAKYLRRRFLKGAT